jgi:hypothetical protein
VVLARRVSGAGALARAAAQGTRFVAALVCLALIPLGAEVDAVVALAAATAVTSAVIAWETIRYAEARRRVRSEHAR